MPWSTQLRTSTGASPLPGRSDVSWLVVQVNPWMRPEVEMIVAQDESVTGMFNWCATTAYSPMSGPHVALSNRDSAKQQWRLYAGLGLTVAGGSSP